MNVYQQNFSVLSSQIWRTMHAPLLQPRRTCTEWRVALILTGRLFYRKAQLTFLHFVRHFATIFYDYAQRARKLCCSVFYKSQL